jgi:hypothetical protein
LSHAAINKRAKRDGWTRNLADRVRKEVSARLVSEKASPETERAAIAEWQRQRNASAPESNGALQQPTPAKSSLASIQTPPKSHSLCDEVLVLLLAVATRPTTPTYNAKRVTKAEIGAALVTVKSGYKPAPLETSVLPSDAD